MRKNKLGGSGKVLATGALAAAALAAPLKAKATTLDYVNTIIHNTEDMDPNKAGTQWRYDWEVKNLAGQHVDDDAVFQYNIQADLEERGMYGFESDGGLGPWSFVNGDTSFFEPNSPPQQGFPIYSGLTTTFYAYIDADDVLGNEWVGSYGLSNEGATQVVDVQVPVTRLQRTTKGIPFGWLYDQGIVTSGGSSAYEAGSLIDTDLDGFFNWEEYIADTGPNLSNSYFRVECSASELSWHSATGRTYTLRGTATLTNTFSVISNFTGIAGTLTYSDLLTDAFSYYRLNAKLTE